MSDLKAKLSSTSRQDPNPTSGIMMQQVLPFALLRGKAMVEKPQDLFIPPDALEVILEMFEGPLDLLLYLIRKQKFDILDLPIAPITTQYMTYVDLMKDIKLELAAEYLVMASILAEIKSRLLLPKQAVEEDEGDPRAELVRKLQEYEVIKNAAENIDQLPRIDRDSFIAKVELAENFVPEIANTQVDLTELVAALQGVIKRTQAFEHHHIQKESLSTRERMAKILSTLKEAKDNQAYCNFSDLFTIKEGRQGVVVTFLAILELIKESLITCIQTQVYGEIHVSLPKS
ncbi:segregation/condensation protein A [Colwellia sp. M166]|uniref:segregation and condensation protein A n=1 Tax=Colwellia sp. M166 TaxID=2583805 RepID=UPI00220045CD|nr:segregation/condensation protein A [Colwellia sp. M166]|tara:strand:- start:5539 stop:6402 length:864 start_codon:yes stop_codon:yes gene_type:complete